MVDPGSASVACGGWGTVAVCQADQDEAVVVEGVIPVVAALWAGQETGVAVTAAVE